MIRAETDLVDLMLGEERNPRSSQQEEAGAEIAADSKESLGSSPCPLGPAVTSRRPTKRVFPHRPLGPAVTSKRPTKRAFPSRPAQQVAVLHVGPALRSLRDFPVGFRVVISDRSFGGAGLSGKVRLQGERLLSLLPPPLPSMLEEFKVRGCG